MMCCKCFSYNYTLQRLILKKMLNPFKPTDSSLNMYFNLINVN